MCGVETQLYFLFLTHIAVNQHSGHSAAWTLSTVNSLDTLSFITERQCDLLERM